MKDLRGQARVTAFLRNALAEAPQDVLKLEAMARTEGLLGDRQRITHTKPFKRGKHSLGIRSVRAGFGTNGGWRWELPCDRDGAVASQPVRAERCIPVGWVEGVARLDDYRPPSDVPRHRWRQFVSDCQSFLNSSENWAERAAELGEIIDLLYYHEKSVEEVAEIVGIPENTVKTRMFYARKKLAELVASA
jgi:hypothetical protein